MSSTDFAGPAELFVYCGEFGDSHVHVLVLYSRPTIVRQFESQLVKGGGN
jgi:hypothetical protein